MGSLGPGILAVTLKQTRPGLPYRAWLLHPAETGSLVIASAPLVVITDSDGSTNKTAPVRSKSPPFLHRADQLKVRFNQTLQLHPFFGFKLLLLSKASRAGSLNGFSLVKVSAELCIAQLKPTNNSPSAKEDTPFIIVFIIQVS